MQPRHGIIERNYDHAKTEENHDHDYRKGGDRSKGCRDDSS